MEFWVEVAEQPDTAVSEIISDEETGDAPQIRIRRGAQQDRRSFLLWS